jgi:DNA-directed RNA polymerase subunit RPC12/RpoP
MAVAYAYRCDGCGTSIESNVRGDRVPCSCGLTASRRFRFSMSTSFREHFNVATGQYVNNNREFTDALKRASEEQTARTGLEVNLEPVDYSDKAALGVTDEGLDETAKARFDSV